MRINPNKKAIFEVCEQYSVINFINFVHSGDGLKKMMFQCSKNFTGYIE